MLTILLNLTVGVLVGVGLRLGGLASTGWSTFWTILCVVAGQVGVGFLLRSKMQSVMTEIQAIMGGAQKRIQAKMTQWQHRPPSSPKQAQTEVEQEQQAAVNQALAVVEKLAPYYKWIPLLSRQADTMRMQFYWQLKQFDKVDRLMPRAMMADPMLMCVKLARSYMTGASMADLAALFKKFSGKVRYGQGELLYGMYAWMLVQKNDLDGALKVLVASDSKMESPTLKRNRDHLANNRANQFSLSGLGDNWYSMFLEEPKVKQQRVRHTPGRYF